ncbi:hypothetical protein L207DRAFT_592981 [Hyaloscypha variabilis F]|uniref:Uncharacterized protein n=1 Tax=Hyaloscypha variabilis (strain UAMH 11265 / GT02V1 / F) TaxID=1149755 RepID=A0A2J6QUJ1_HYAVF|nr:hypothetical protein L207DRAFT_592981 [Hyaloscypha variabilis F]
MQSLIDYAVECILQVRTEVVDLILETAYNRVDLYLHLGESLCDSDKHNARSEECGAIILGSLLRGLQKLGILPKTAANKANTKTDHMSVDELMEGLNNIRIKSLHSMCSDYTPFSIDIEDYLPAFGGLVLESHRRHMKQ